MQRIPSPNVAEIVLVCNQDNQTVINKFHVKSNTGWTTDFLSAVGERVKDWWTTNMGPASANNVSLQQIVVNDLTTPNGQGVVVGDGLPVAGSGGDTPLPNSVTIAVKWTTGLRGRSYSGRTYVIGLREGSVSGNRITPSFQAGLLTIFTALKDTLSFGAGQVYPVVLSEVHNKAPRAEGVATPITGITIDPIIDSQRRRLPGRGR